MLKHIYNNYVKSAFLSINPVYKLLYIQDLNGSGDNFLQTLKFDWTSISVGVGVNVLIIVHICYYMYRDFLGGGVDPP